MRIAEDRGGQIGHYLQAYSMLRSSGENVVVDGNCLSACTLVLGLIPRERMCATPRARFGFHAAWMPDEEGRPVTSPMGTQALWNIYPTSVRRWITHHGGLSRKMIFMQGHDLGGIVASCEQPPPTRSASAPAARDTSTHTKRLASANRDASTRTKRVASAKSEHRLTTGSVRYKSASAASDRR